MNTQMNTIDFAKAYAKNGWQSFPCLFRDKKPAVKWTEAATTEINMLSGWWDDTGANIALACGARSGIVVIDIDREHDGFYSLADLAREYGDLPITPTVKTGNNGEHIYFKHPGFEIRNSAGKLGRGIDVRGDGGYVVSPPSIHPNGKVYEWIVKPSETPLADMPEWMIGLLQAPNETQGKPISDGMIPDGQKHDFFVKLAGSMRRKGFSAAAIYQALLVENNTRCINPAPSEHVLEIAQDIHNRYEPKDEIKVISPLPTAWDVIDKLELEIHERKKNPKDVWGIHYAWPYLSVITGGKQEGELILLAGEPKVGKSWWAHQDALYTALGNPVLDIPSTPVLIWSGEMSRKQVYRRFFEMLGVQKRRMMTGGMNDDDWQTFREAKALIVNSPIYVSDQPLDLQDVHGLLEREIGEHGIKQVVFDYDWLINAPGKDEIATSQNISRAMKNLSREFNISIVLISSVNKGGMDTMSENVAKSNVSGSGKKIHDADVVYMLTKFNSNKNSDLSILPQDYDRISTLHIAAARDMDFHLPGGAINYMRETPNPRFKELKDLAKKDTLPSWMKRSDLK